jgi:hypothetical protein
MTNTPPDPGSSRLGFDELVGIIIAFATIGTILALTLGRTKGFNPGGFLSSSPITPTPEATEGATPVAPIVEATPEVTPSPSPQAAAIAPSPVPATPSPIATASPVPTAEQGVKIVPPVVMQAPPAQRAPKKATTTERAPKKATTANVSDFPDVPKDLWARPYIEALAAQGLISGFLDGSFKPGNAITRAEFAALLQKAFEPKQQKQVTSFTDVKPNFWALPAIQESTKSGFLQGYPGNVFRPDQQIPRVQVMVALANGIGLPQATNPQQVLQPYQDAAQIPNYARGAVAAATQAGLVVNYPNPKVLNPNRNANRAEVAAMVYQALVKAGKMQPISSQYIVKP